MLLRPVGTVIFVRSHPTVNQLLCQQVWTKKRVKFESQPGTYVLYHRGKIENLIQETKRININVMSVAEMRWKNQRQITNNGYQVLWSSGQKLEHGVGFVLDPLASKEFTEYLTVSDRIILLKM